MANQFTNSERFGMCVNFDASLEIFPEWYEGLTTPEQAVERFMQEDIYKILCDDCEEYEEYGYDGFLTLCEEIKSHMLMDANDHFVIS